MKNRVQLHTPTGLATIVSLTEFVRDIIPIEIVKNKVVHVPVLKSPSMTWGGDDFSLGSMGPTITDRKILLDKYYEMSDRDIIRSSPAVHIASLREYWMKYVVESGMEDLKQMILNKEETFYVPELGLHKINELCLKLIENAGGGNVFCFYHSFSKYQNYFIISSNEAFKNFFTEPYPLPDKAAYRGYCKLADINPNKWIMGRADNIMSWQLDMVALRMPTFQQTVDDAAKYYDGRLVEPNPTSKAKYNYVIKPPGY